jgi:nucleotide-binding universal stress UspA family protein
MKPIRRILHPTDFSPASRGAFARAVALARTNRAALTLVHVHSPVIPVAGEAYYALPQAYERMLAEIRADARKQLERLAARAKKAGVRTKSLLAEGTPHDRIVRAAKSTRADMIVMGTSGRTGLARFFIGSVAARVIAVAPCPVLTVRGK